MMSLWNEVHHHQLPSYSLTKNNVVTHFYTFLNNDHCCNNNEKYAVYGDVLDHCTFGPLTD